MGKLEEAIARGIEKGMWDTWRYSRRICPVDSGLLRASISWKVESGNIILGAYTDYAEYIEFGTVRMTKSHGRHDPKRPVTSWKALKDRGGRNQMMPFIRPAIHLAVKKFIPDRIREEVRKL